MKPMEALEKMALRVLAYKYTPKKSNKKAGKKGRKHTLEAPRTTA